MKIRKPFIRANTHSTGWRDENPAKHRVRTQERASRAKHSFRAAQTGMAAGNPASPTIWPFGTVSAPLCVFMGYFGILVFWCIAWLTVLYGQKVGNALETGPSSVADLVFEPLGIVV